MEKWKYITVLLLVGWIYAAYTVISPYRCSNNTFARVSELQKKLLKLDSILQEKLRQQITKLNQMLQDHGPSQEYENLRRRIYSNTKELWYFIRHRLGEALNENSKPDQIRVLLREMADRKRSLLSELEQLPALDGHEAWRRQEAASVSDLVQRRLHHLQHPRDCRAAKKLVCEHDNCGFGCQLHHLAYCLILAYATERTLILKSKGWRYSQDWEDTFYPLSDTCNSTYEEKLWKFSVTQKAKVVSLPLLYYLAPKPTFLPLAIPEDLSDRIVRFNGDPSSWWIAQIIKYILKPRKHIQKLISDIITRMDFKLPIVGVHIRRTDKVDTEAEFHNIEEYMSHVGDYYEQLKITRAVHERNVYLATDDAKLLKEARQKFPQFTFYGDQHRAKTAETYQRYKPPALTNLLVDLHLLSMSDYLVCTFSSQFGLLSYEMMQANRVDASNSFYSLDDLYHFVGQNPHSRIIVLNDNNTALQVGGEINTTGLLTGYNSRGKKSKQDGIIPWYKTADYVEVYPFPEYKQVPLFTYSR